MTFSEQTNLFVEKEGEITQAYEEGNQTLRADASGYLHGVAAQLGNHQLAADIDHLARQIEKGRQRFVPAMRELGERLSALGVEAG